MNLLSFLPRVGTATTHMRQSFLWLLVIVVSACGGGSDQVAGGVGSGGTGGGNASVAYGAALVKSLIEIKDAQGLLLLTAVSDEQGTASFDLPQNATFPLFVQARVSSVAGMNTFHALVLNAEQAKQINVNQVSELLTALTLEQAPEVVFSQANFAEQLTGITEKYQTRITQLQTALQAVFNTKKSLIPGEAATTAIRSLLTQKFAHDNTGWDAILDDVRIQKSGNDYQISIPSVPSIPSFRLSPTAPANEAFTLPNNYASQVAAASQNGALTAMPVTVALSTPSTWGSISDSWSGYTGAMALYTPYDLPADWILSFESDTLQAEIFWNARLIRKEDIINPDGSHAQRFTLQGDGASVKPAGSLFSIGFSGVGVLDSQVIFRHCRINNRACAVRFTTGEKNTVASLFGAFSVAQGATPTQLRQTITQTAKAPEVTIEWRSESNNAYGLTITVKNVSDSALQAGSTGWHFVLPLTSGVLGDASDLWNFDASFSASAGGYANGGYIVTPKPTAGPLGVGNSVISDFNGSGAITQMMPTAPLPANIRYGCTLQKRLHSLNNSFVVEASCPP